VNLVLAEAANSAPLPEPARFINLTLFVLFGFLFFYFVASPSIVYRCTKANIGRQRKMILHADDPDYTDEELFEAAKKRSQVIRSIMPIVLVCIIAFTELIDPYNWIFVVIFGPLLAFSYYKIVGSIMNLQALDDETSNERTD
jgi:hypothetical protein